MPGPEQRRWDNRDLLLLFATAAGCIGVMPVLALVLPSGSPTPLWAQLVLPVSVGLIATTGLGASQRRERPSPPDDDTPA